MTFEKRHTKKSNRHTNKNPAKNTKIGLLYLIEIGWVEGGHGGSKGGLGGLNRIKHDF
jgi:hypothetical protein